MKKVALYFGSFNPIHIGHLIVANYVLQHGGVNELWFVISPQNPFKKQDELAAESHRYNMVKCAIEGTPGLLACDIEFSLARPSFTANTLRELAESHPGFEFSIVLGEDNQSKFHQWKEYEWILQHYRILFYPRANSWMEDSPVNWSAFQVQVIDAPQIGISSTYIRAEINAGRDIRFLTPDVVVGYIQDHQLYL
ncbi:MAG: nicotinate-nucleotide adenylyltransferase [Flavobacteriales bacterium]|nr:nicotinate-nucleotide adenylyltransferase [Flavobacteriales bacterium]